MSLEQKLETLTAAVEANTAAIATMGEVLAGANAKAKSGPAEKPKTTRKPAAGKKPKGPTEEDIREKFGGYMRQATAKKDKAALIATCKPILEHFGVERFSAIPEEHWAEAISFVDALQEGFDADGIDGAKSVVLPFQEGDSDDGGTDDEDLL